MNQVVTPAALIDASAVLRLRRMGIGVLAMVAASAACADDWGGSVAIASDKVFRGISQSEGRAAVLLDVNRRADTGWVASLGLAAPGPRSQGLAAELTVTLGKNWQLDSDWNAYLGVGQYAYLGGTRQTGYAYTYSYGSNDDYAEFNASLGWQGRVLASVAFSPDTSGANALGGRRTDRAVAWELTLHERLAGRLALDAGIGYYDLRAIRGVGYAYGSVGVSWGLGPVQAYLTFIDSRADARGVVPSTLAGERWVASLLWSF